MYRENARKDYLSLAKCRKCSAKRIRQAIKKQLQYVRHDIGHINCLLETEGVSLSVKPLTRLNVIRELFFHSRNTCIKTTSIALRTGSSVLASHYPERVLVDQIYRNRANRAFCKAHDIRISGPALGRPGKITLGERKQSYTDNTDRIEVERRFSLAKHCFGLGLIRTKLDTTTLNSIALSLIAMNLDKMAGDHFLPERFYCCLRMFGRKIGLKQLRAHLAF